MKRLEGKVAFLTGAGSGIARAAAIAFAREGASVAVVDVNREAAEETVRLVRQHRDAALAVAADLTRDDSVRTAVAATVSAFGQVDVLFNCAGGSVPADTPVHEMSLDVWHSTMALNLLNPFLCCRHVLPHMLARRKGAIINMSSHLSLAPSVRPIYTAAKGGVNALTRTLAAQYAEHGIRANAIACGTVLSERLRKRIAELNAAASGEMSAEAAERAALQKLYPYSVGEPEEVAAVAVFLASDESRMVNGAVVAAEGGRSAYLKVLAAAE